MNRSTFRRRPSGNAPIVWTALALVAAGCTTRLVVDQVAPEGLAKNRVGIVYYAPKAYIEITLTRTLKKCAKGVDDTIAISHTGTAAVQYFADTTRPYVVRRLRRSLIDVQEDDDQR